MPKLSKLNTWGRFFGLNLELEHSETNGYSIKSTSRFRLPPYQGFENYLNQHFSPESIDYVLNQKTIPVFKSLERVYFEDHNDEIEIKSISDELGKEVGILELNFDQVTYKSSAGLFTKEVDINKLVLENCYPQFHKSLGISKNDLFNALNTAPVIPSDSVSYMANLLIFKTLIGDFIDRGEVKEQLLVVTGEMVWSGWLSLLGISEFLLRTIMDNKEIIIDQYAIWPLITRISKQEPELLMLNSSFFKPNLYAINDYYVDKKDSAVIVEDFFKDRKFYLNE
ncbi:hypothetical protein KC909_03060, partial [Candidatus Dojkabacteria bacterium]|nr:hypothetical protein [Candidatus Dojkabacteria bacterium]